MKLSWRQDPGQSYFWFAVAREGTWTITRMAVARVRKPTRHSVFAVAVYPGRKCPRGNKRETGLWETLTDAKTWAQRLSNSADWTP